MPNIMIFGLNLTDCKVESKKIALILAQSQLPYRIYNEMVITCVPSECYGVSDIVVGGTIAHSQLFLRVCSDDAEEIKQIVELLNEKGYEIETLLIHRFYPGKRRPLLGFET